MGNLGKTLGKYRKPRENIGKYENLGETLEKNWKPWILGKTLGKPWENLGKTLGEYGKPCEHIGNFGETLGKPWENLGKYDNLGETLGKPWENMGNLGKTLGKCPKL